MKKIYGVELDGQVTVPKVRDAIVECFYQAHHEDAGVTFDSEQSGRKYCQELIEKFFREINADFDDPTKKELLDVIEKLKKFSRSFRSNSVIGEHYKQIMLLIDKLN